MRTLLTYLSWWLFTPHAPKRHGVLVHDEKGCRGLWLLSLTDSYLLCIRCQSRVENTEANQQDAWNENAAEALLQSVEDAFNDNEEWAA